MIPQLQYIDQVFDVLVAQFQQICAKSWETVEIPQLQLDFPGQVVARPLCATTDAHGRRSSSTVVNVPVIMRDSGNATDSGHREFLVDIPARNRDRCSTFNSGSDDGFLTHFASFFALFRLSRS